MNGLLLSALGTGGLIGCCITFGLTDAATKAIFLYQMESKTLCVVHHMAYRQEFEALQYQICSLGSADCWQTTVVVQWISERTKMHSESTISVESLSDHQINWEKLSTVRLLLSFERCHRLWVLRLRVELKMFFAVPKKTIHLTITHTISLVVFVYSWCWRCSRRKSEAYVILRWRGIRLYSRRWYSHSKATKATGIRYQQWRRVNRWTVRWRIENWIWNEQTMSGEQVQHCHHGYLIFIDDNLMRYSSVYIHSQWKCFVLVVIKWQFGTRTIQHCVLFPQRIFARFGSSE